MSLSLRDQLLKAGLVDEKKAKQADRQKKKQKKLENHGQAQADTSQQEAARKAQEEKIARDQELNRQQKEKQDKKARDAQIKQLIESNRLPRLDGDDYYNFVDNKKVKRIAVNDQLREKLSRGTLAIVRHDGKYEMIPLETALKIEERDARRIILLNRKSEEQQKAEEDDPYKDFVVPDDLMW